MADINEIISPAAIKGIQRTTEELEKANAEIEKAIVNSKKLSDNMASIKSMQDLNVATQKSAIEQEKLRKAVAAAQLQEERLSAFRDNEIKKEEARQERLRKAREKANKNNDFNPYKELEEQYKAAAMRAQNLGAQLAKLQNLYGSSPSAAEAARLKTLAKSFDEAAKEAAALQKQLADIDAKVGKYGRNVGNYKSGFNGLQNSINQLTRELPAFTYSFQTGFMAISNNLPIFFDQIKMTREQIKAMREEGKQVPGLLKQIATSFFSWGTALSIGVTLLTVYGKEIGNFIIALFKGAKAIDYFAESQKMMQEVRRKGFQDAQIEIVNLSNLYRAAQNTSLAYNERKKAVDELQKQYPAVLGNLKDEDILAGKAAKSYQFLTQQILATAFASAASSKIAENRLREFDNEEKRIKARIDYAKEEVKIEKLRQQALNARGSAGTGASNSQGYYDMIAKSEERRAAAGKIIREANRDSEELNKRNLRLIQEIDKAVLKYGLNVLGVNEDINKKTNTDEIDLLIQRSKNRIDELKEIAHNENQKLQIRLDAAKKLNGELKKLADLEAKKELMDTEITAARKTAINEQKNYDIRKADVESNNLIFDINKSADQKLAGLIKKGLKEFEDSEKSKIQAVFDSQNEILELIEENRALQVQKTSELYVIGKINKKKYEADLRQIEFDAQKESLRQQIDTIDKAIEIQKENVQFGIGSQKEIYDNERKASKLRISLSQLESDQKIAIKERELEKEREHQRQLQELAQETFDFARSLTNSIFDGNIQSIEKEKKADEDRKNRQIENINESLLSEEQKQEQIAIIESQSEERQRQLDARIAAQKRKQAIADKAFALSQVAINTAIAVAKVWGQTGIFGLAAQVPVLAMGALQAAAILAQPIPEFRHGGTMDKDGIAKFGEVGRELRINPDGSTELTPSSTTLGFVEAGTKFIDAAETRRLMAKPTKVDIAGKSWEVGAMLNEQRKSTDRIEKAVKGININTMVLTKNGIRHEKMRQDRLNKWFRRNF